MRVILVGGCVLALTGCDLYFGHFGQPPGGDVHGEGTPDATVADAVSQASPDARSDAAPDAGVPLTGVDAIAVGAGHACVTVGGRVLCWGENTWGQLGNGSTRSSAVPIEVPGLPGAVQAIAAGGEHTCAIVDGGVWCWGRTSSVSGAWNTPSTVPVAVAGLDRDVQAIAVGQEHACAIVDGGVWCWGRGDYGQLGNGVESTATPVQVAGLTGGVQAIALGAVHTCAIVNGGATCWGSEYYGQLGDAYGGTDVWATSPPVPVVGLDGGVQAIAADGDHSCALVNGGIQCWGDSTAYTEVLPPSNVPVAVAGLTADVGALADGAWFDCALTTGAVECWGTNFLGQLGNGTTTANATPAAVEGLPDNPQLLAANYQSACVVVDGGVWCWGEWTDGVHTSPTRVLAP